MSLTEHAERPAVRWGASTDIGPVRSENEDSWLAVPPVFAVADGMGGHLGGAQASSSAVITLQEFLSTDRLGNRPVDLVDLSVAPGTPWGRPRRRRPAWRGSTPTAW